MTICSLQSKYMMKELHITATSAFVLFLHQNPITRHNSPGPSSPNLMTAHAKATCGQGDTAALYKI